MMPIEKGYAQSLLLLGMIMRHGMIRRPHMYLRCNQLSIVGSTRHAGPLLMADGHPTTTTAKECPIKDDGGQPSARTALLNLTMSLLTIMQQHTLRHTAPAMRTNAHTQCLQMR